VRGPAARCGMTMVEVMVAVVILTISVYLLSSTITATIAHTGGRRERTIAVDAARNGAEIMLGAPFLQVFALFNADPSDDPGGVGTAPGSNFPVPLLVPRTADADGMCGKIVFPNPGPELREDTVAPLLGMPRDLNGDLQIDDQDHSADLLVLPVRIEVEWTGKAGERNFVMYTMFANIQKLSQ